MSETSNATAPFVVGAYVQRPDSYATPSPAAMSDYSSSESEAKRGLRGGPDVSAPGDESSASPGIVVPASFSHDWVRHGGTSLAAPIALRALANRMAASAAALDQVSLHALIRQLGQDVPGTAAQRRRTGDRFLP